MSAASANPPSVAAADLENANGLADAADRAVRGKQRVILTRDGKPVAAVVPIEDLEMLETLEDQQDSRAAAEALARWEAEGRPMGASLQDLAKRWDVDLASEAE